MEKPFKVEVKLVIISLHDVDTLNERFTAEIYIESRWPLEYEEFHNNNDNNSNNNNNIIDVKTITKTWKPKWSPNLEILNLISKEKFKCWYKISELNKKNFIFEMKRLKGKLTFQKLQHKFTFLLLFSHFI